MFRYLVAHVPTFRLDRCGWAPHQSVVLIAEEKNALRVQCASLAAVHRGIRPGMSVAAARAHVPEVETELLDSNGEAEDLTALTAQLLRVSPTIASLPPDALVAEISRIPEARAGQERALLERVRTRLDHLGHRATVVVADDPLTALTVARWRRKDAVLSPGEGVSALAPLPLIALDLPEAEHALLDDLGIHTIGAFAALPPASVAGRMGPLGVAAHALARGRAPTPTLPPWDEDGPLVLTQVLPTPVVELDALLFVIVALLRDATARLMAARRGATRIEFGFGLDNSTHQTISIRLGKPTRDVHAIREQVHHRLDRVQLGSAACTVTLTVSESIPFDGQQMDLRDPRRTHEAIGEVTARLQDALGGPSVLAVRAVSRHRPEGAWRPVPFGTTVPRGSTAAAEALCAAHAPDPVDAWQGHSPQVAPQRPPILLSPPQAIDIEPGMPVQAVHVDGRWQAVVSVEGPEQLSGEWWRRSFQRTYWRATLGDGRTAWMYREHGQWAIHGWWDR